ncbi:winged helix DNA-binding domain-containing protein [Amycolatopsis roodepoortensis]|uniref:winged helix DNA-binding domain-containing protein n=1 Tax=Amycolatopsis roodepoortensis TaxID=700274 RepID=UPI00214CFD4A|nr:winged helix DNA-binding domain-containing protein [Amycolatopsis roodepoortensis]UUV28210.1 winged helix DNA-binding domain-containing protein [Amycolatopsis roodepoortensis]
MATDKLRAWWAHRQGLDGTLHGSSAAAVLERTGWMRSVGGSAPYLGLFARARLDRETVDADVAQLAIHELPSARGCTYVLPSADFELGLTVGAAAPAGELAAAEKYLGVTQAEIEQLCVTVADLLDGEPLSPAAIKEAAGPAVRNLGEAGRKRGTTTTLPLALGLLQARGDIRRVPVTGRLDQQRYGYVRWTPSPRGALSDMDTARTELARRYFSWAAPASLKHFRWFSGFTAASAKKIAEQLELVSLDGTDLLLPKEIADEFAAFTVPSEPSYALLAGIDGIHLLHREMPRLLADADVERPVPGGRAGETLGGQADPPSHVIVDRGRIAGLWEFDTETGKIVHRFFGDEDAALRETIARTEEFVRDQLGDARSFSLDSPKSRASRVADLRLSPR